MSNGPISACAEPQVRSDCSPGFSGGVPQAAVFPAGLYIILGILTLALPQVLAMPVASAQTYMTFTPARENAVTKALQGTNRRAQAGAISFIEAEMRSHPGHAVMELDRYWLRELMAIGRYRTTAKLARQGVLAVPGWEGVVANLLMYRVEALTALGHSHAALRNAKSLFNVCPLRTSGAALVILDQCLGVVYWKHPGIVAEFEREQRVGSAMPADDSEPIIRSGVMASIQVNAKPYLKRLAGIHSQSPHALLIKGNLLLLAAEPLKAIKCFRMIEDFASPGSQFLAAEENICRAIKAEDGTVGRANSHRLQFLKSLPGNP